MMRHLIMGLVAGFAMTLATAVAMGQPEAASPSAADSQPDAKAGEDEASSLSTYAKLRIGSLKITGELYMAEGGRVTLNRMRCRLTLLVDYLGPGQLRGFSDLEMTRVETDLGEQLQAEFDVGLHAAQSFRRVLGEFRGPASGLKINLDVPATSAFTLEHVEGKIDLMIGSGELRRAVVADVASVLGRRVRVAQIEGGWFRFQNNPSGYRLTCSPAALHRLAKVEFEDEAGMPIEIDPGSTSLNGYGSVLLRVDRERVKRAILSFDNQLRRATLPIKLSDIPLPGTEQRKRARQRQQKQQSR